MPTLAERLRLLGWAPRGPRIATLLATVEAASDAEFLPILESLLQHASAGRHAEDVVRGALLAVGARVRSGRVKSYPPCMARLEQPKLESALDEFLRSDVAEELIAAVSLVALIPVGAFAGRLPPLLAHAHEPVGAAAETALTSLVDWLLAARRDGRAVVAGPIGAALVDACERFRAHRRSDVLRLFAKAIVSGVRLHATPEPGKKTIGLDPAWLSDQEHPALLGLRRLLRSATADAPIHAAAWMLLKHPAVAGACADKLQAANADELAELGLRAHLAENPLRCTQLKRLVGEAGMVRATVLPTADQTIPLPTKARMGLARFVAVVPAATRLRDAALASILADDAPAVRHAAVRAASTLPSRPSCLLDFCFDPHERVARSAVLAVACQTERGLVQDPLRDRTLAGLRRSPHSRVARIASESVAADAFASPDSAPARLALRRRAAGEPDGLAPILAAGLEHHDIARRCAAVVLTRRMGLSSALAPTLRAVLEQAIHGRSEHAEDALVAERLLPAVASALGDLDDDASGELLRRCLHRAEARLRANALDAIARRARRAGAPGEPPLLADETHAMARGLCQDEAHRPRASAARLLLSVSPLDLPRSASVRDPGERALVSMLEDDRPMHQVAGLWLAERAASRVAPLPEVVDAVAALAKAAEGGPVRERARRTAQRLVIEIRSGWILRAKSMSLAPPGSRADAEEEAA